MIDNLAKILPLLQWQEEGDDLYTLQVMQRGKEHSNLSSRGRVVKNYFIRNEEYLLKHYDEIKRLCDEFDARAMIRLNCRSMKLVAFRMLSNLAEALSQEDYEHLYKIYVHAATTSNIKYQKLWLIDIDDITDPQHEDVVRALDIISDVTDGADVVKGIIPSNSGLHLITSGFDIRKLREAYPAFSLHKDNPTNLYIPDIKGNEKVNTPKEHGDSFPDTE